MEGCYPLPEHPSDVSVGLSDRNQLGVGGTGDCKLLPENVRHHGRISPLLFTPLIQDQPGVPISLGIFRHDVCAKRRVMVGRTPSAPSQALRPDKRSTFPVAKRILVFPCRMDTV